MAELGAVGSVVGIASFGLKFAMTLHTYVEGAIDAQHNLQRIALDVSATASALEQLSSFAKPAANGAAMHGNATMSEPGRQQLLKLATQCEQVYTAMIVIIGEIIEVPKNNKSEEVTLETLELGALKVTSIRKKLQWPFREQRMKKLQEELGWLKISLVFQIQLMELVKTKSAGPARTPSDLEKEFALQTGLEQLQRRRESYARRLAARRKQKSRHLNHKKHSTKPTAGINLAEVVAELPAQSPRGGTGSTVRMTNIPPKPISSSGFPGPQPGIGSRILTKNQNASSSSDSEPNSEPPDTETNIQQDERPQHTDTDASLSHRSTSLSRAPVLEGVTEDASSHKPPLIKRIRGLHSAAKLGLRKRVLKRNPQGWKPDWSNHDLEAWLVHINTKATKKLATKKLAFSRQELERMARDIARSREVDVNGVYPNMLDWNLEVVHEVIVTASSEDGRTRTCIAMKPQDALRSQDNYGVIIFAIEPPAEPINVIYAGRTIQLSFELCRSWDRMEEQVRETILYGPGRDYELIRRSKLQFSTLDSKYLTPASWENFVKPGWIVQAQSFPKPPVSLHPPKQHSFPELLSHPVAMGSWADDRPAPAAGGPPPPVAMASRAYNRPAPAPMVPLPPVTVAPDYALPGPAACEVPPPLPTPIAIQETKSVRTPLYPDSSEDSSDTSSAPTMKSLEQESTESDQSERGEKPVSSTRDIVNFEEEEQAARQTTTHLLAMWTTAFDSPPAQEEREQEAQQ